MAIPSRRRDNTHDVILAAFARHEVRQDVPVGPPPLSAVRNLESAQPLGRKDRPLRYRTNESWRLGAEQTLAHLGPDAVGADNDFSFDTDAVLESKTDCIALLVDSDETMVESDRPGGDNAFQHAMQVAAMNIDIGTTVTRFTRRVE